MYEVHLSRNAHKAFQKLERSQRDRVERRLAGLAEEPVPQDAKFIKREKGEAIFRLRIGHLRSLYKVNSGKEIILIAKIDKRPTVYQRRSY